MPPNLLELILSPDPAIRNSGLESRCAASSADDLLVACAELDSFRRTSENLYERVRALFFLHAIHRFHLPARLAYRPDGRIPFHGYEHLLARRFEESIDAFLSVQREAGPSDALSSALAMAYGRLAFQTLADQVRRSVRGVRGNQWMFRTGHAHDHPLRFRKELLGRAASTGSYPILVERTPVRMDLTHSAWSDIFFLGMDFPEGARVLNLSVDLGIHGRDDETLPPVSAWLRVIDSPVLRLVSIDLGAEAEITALPEVFDFAKDYLGLLKAAVIASGLVPPGLEGSGQKLSDVLARVVGPGRGIELVSLVNDIPKGSRLAVSTNLLASLIAVIMRATGQASSLTGPLEENERRVVLARALLGEWLGGSGGGWQDSGGVWPGLKLIEGVPTAQGDVEFGISRGCLMPRHTVLGPDEVTAETRRKLQDSLIVVHGGMAQNVGPILEMVTERYLLRSGPEWQARHEALGVMDDVLSALRQGDIRALGSAVTRNFEGPIRTIIPWASNAFTERLIAAMRSEFGGDFWGFWMLGGMSGGGMGFIFDPAHRDVARERLLAVMKAAHADLSASLPFAMEPVIYNFRINESGTSAELIDGKEALMPRGYYTLLAPRLLRTDPRELPASRRSELDRFGAACRTDPRLSGVVQELFERLIPRSGPASTGAESLASLLQQNGFDAESHERIRSDLRSGRIGLSQNRLPPNTKIEDVQEGDFVDLHNPDEKLIARGRQALAAREVGVITLAAGAASRWTQGAGVVKSLNPFCRLAGAHRTFLEVHLAKSCRTASLYGAAPAHVITTGYLTHEPIARFLKARENYGYPGPLRLSPGRSVGLRMVPTVRDLRYAWEEMPQQMLDEQQQKVRESLRAALLAWAESAGEASDYTDNAPPQCLHPVGHWYEVPNMLLNGTLASLLEERPRLRTLMLHNIDTVGANLDPASLGAHLDSGATLSFEVIPRRIEDRGGGLARVDGRVRLIEGLALPREEIEFGLSFYNSMTTWIDIDGLLAAFELDRTRLGDQELIREKVRKLANRVPTYITLKDVKKRWGHAQEDVFPVAQFEKLWSDLTAMDELSCRFLVVPRARGQQLKEPAQLDGWLRDGSAAWVESLCEWQS